MPDDEQKPDAKPSPPSSTASEPHEEASADGSVARGDRGEDPTVAPASPAAQAVEATAEDRFRPEAIAARIDSIGDESAQEREAREEERKLNERRKGTKKGKRGLESAASKRLAKIGEGKVKRPSATADADAVTERTDKARRWINQNKQLVGGLVAVGVLAVGGFLGWTYWEGSRNADASALLAQAFADEHGRVDEKADDADEEGTSRSLYPVFKSVDERRDAALGKYREVESKYPGTGAAILSRLAEGSLLLDKRDAAGATAAYHDVLASALAQVDLEVRGRALEGQGFVSELLAETDAANRAKHLDEALASFHQLEIVDVDGFKELGLYHQARVLQEKGDKAKAIELLKDVHKRISEPGESQPFLYLTNVVEDRLRALDPTALPPKSPPMPTFGGPGGAQGLDPEHMDSEQLKRLIEQMQKQNPRKPGSAPAPGSDPGNAP